jgi:hypothetical protein
MDEQDADMNTMLMVDGNAVAGELAQIFGRDLTMAVTRCGGCGADSRVGALMAFVRGPGVVLRCPVCGAITVRIVETPTEYYLDARGVIYMRIDRAAST